MWLWENISALVLTTINSLYSTATSEAKILLYQQLFFQDLIQDIWESVFGNADLFMNGIKSLDYKLFFLCHRIFWFERTRFSEKELNEIHNETPIKRRLVLSALCSVEMLVSSQVESLIGCHCQHQYLIQLATDQYHCPEQGDQHQDHNT